MTVIVCTTELDAVNSMLGAIGEAPINTLTNLSPGDAAVAYNLLNETSREVLTSGWTFNTDYEFPILPDSNGKIKKPTNAVRIYIANSMEPNYDMVERQGFMYDRAKKTNVFPVGTAIKFNIVWLFTFEDCPEEFRHYITVRAGRKFLDRTVGNQDLHGFSASDELTALAALKDFETESSDLNILTGNYDVYRALDRSYTWGSVIPVQ
jgi:hypothetical protein